MLLHASDCLIAPWASRRNAWITDPPANIAFMGRKWDKAAAELGFVPPLPPRSKEHLRELQSEFSFQRYWGERFGMMYDQSEDDAVAFVWALPRTAHLTQTALRWAGWRILDSWHHAFGQGWNKNGGHLKPAHELWFAALKGKPKLNIDAGRVNRGGGVYGSGANAGSGGTNQRNNVTRNGGRGIVAESNPLGSHPPNFAMSHHPDCVRIGERKVKESDARKADGTRSNKQGQTWDVHATRKGPSTFTDNGTESLPAYSCAVSCPCGRHWIQPSGGSPSECECGRMGEWVCPVAELDEQSGHLSGRNNKRPSKGGGGSFGLPKIDHPFVSFGDEGGASRFFPTFGYYAKASGRTDDAEVKRLEKLEKKRAKATDPIEIARLEGRIRAQQKVVDESDNTIPRGERHAGCEELYWRANPDNPFGFDRVKRQEWEELPAMVRSIGSTPSVSADHGGRTGQRARGNVHPTVKGIEMMMYLIKLSGGDKIGDLCFGSGGTAIACQLLGLDFEGAELCPEAVEITNARLTYWRTLSLSALHALMLNQPIQNVLKVNEKSRTLAISEVQ